MALCCAQPGIADVGEMPVEDIAHLPALEPTTSNGVAAAESGDVAENEIAAQTNAHATATHYVTQIESLAAEGKGEQALLIALDGLARYPDDTGLLKAMGTVQRMQGSNEEALETYAHILELTPGDIDAQLLTALLLQTTAQEADVEVALDRLLRAAALVPGNIGIAVDLLHRAQEGDRPDLVMKTYDGLPEAERSTPEVLASAAAASRALKQTDQAIDLFTQLLAKSGDNIAATLGLAGTLVDAKRFDEATPVIQQALSQYPDQAALYELQFQVQLATGHVWDSLSSLTALIRLDANNADAINEKARLLLDLGCNIVAAEFVEMHAETVSPETQAATLAACAAARERWAAATPTVGGQPDFLTLAYGDITPDAAADGSASAQPLARLIEQLEFLRGRGHVFISERDIGAAQRGKAPLPARAVLLTFDNAYASFADIVLPVLAVYGCPAIVGIPTAQIGASPTGKGTLMSWKQIKQVGQHPLVTVASQTHASAGYSQANPQGLLTPTLVTRLYHPDTLAYETADAYAKRIEQDIVTSVKTILDKTGMRCDVMLWPEGRFNEIALQAAIRHDFATAFARSEVPAPTGSKRVIQRWQVPPTATLAEFINGFYQWRDTSEALDGVHAMPLNLDSIYAVGAVEWRQNLAAAVDRIVASGANTVFVRGFSDPESDGSVKSVYFPNRVLPVTADILSHVVTVLKARGLKVYVTMPALSVVFPVGTYDERHYIKEYRWGRLETPSWFKRLSPFHKEAMTHMVHLYEDLAAHVDCDGVVTWRDAFIAEAEDFSFAGAKAARDKLRLFERNPKRLTETQRREWTRVKTEALEAHLEQLGRAVKRYRPICKIGATVFASSVLDPAVQVRTAQRYGSLLSRCDLVVVRLTSTGMGSDNPSAWCADLIAHIEQEPLGLDRTVILSEIYDPISGKHMKRREWQGLMQRFMGAGIRHLSFEPDLPLEDTPPLKAIKASWEPDN